MLKQVISGGQTGADIAGLKAAKAAGIRTGGTINQGFKTLDGNRPEYKQLYGLQEIKSVNYPDRTKANVKKSDATIIFATNFNSRGVALTIRYAESMGKPILLVHPRKSNIEQIVRWLEDNDIGILNVAGNSECKSSGIEKASTQILLDVFNAYYDREIIALKQAMFDF